MSILSDLHESIKKKNLQELSKGIEKLKLKKMLTDENKKQINLWIDENFSQSLISVAKSLFEPDEDEKEHEEKFPVIHPKNICSVDSQQDLIGNPLPSSMEQIITFLLPKNKKSECITETDMSKIVSSREDEIYLYDSSKNEILTSVPVYRLPTSGIWIVGHSMYFRIFRTYQLESFGKHIISSSKHRIGSIWQQEHELFLAKPLHWNGFDSFIQNNSNSPIIPSACICMFKPEKTDWSAAAKYSFPIDECEWMIPTWNGIPIFLGKICGNVLNWKHTELVIPEISGIIETLGTLTRLKTSVNEIKTIINSLSGDIDNNKVYIETDQGKFFANDFVYSFKWLKPHLKLSIEIDDLEEISIRLKSWPFKLEIEMKMENKLEGYPTAIKIDDQPVINIGQMNRFASENLRFDWIIDISNHLPSVPKSLLSLSAGNLMGLINTFSAFIRNNIPIYAVQGENRVSIKSLNAAILIYGDGHGQDLVNNSSLTELVDFISENVKTHGPALKLLIDFDLDKLPNTEEPIKILSGTTILLPLNTAIYTNNNQRPTLLSSYSINLH